MTIKEQILIAIEYYKTGKYDTATFCDIIGGLYYFESSGYRYFHDDERKYLGELVDITESLSPYEDDLKDGPYFSEEQVKEKFNEVITKLKW